MYKRLININGTQVLIVGFNSCTMTNESPQQREIGIVETAQLSLCDKLIAEVATRSINTDFVRKIAVVHHHPVYIPSLAAHVENYDAILQAGKLLSYLQKKGFDLILHGHKHYPIAWVHNMIPYEVSDDTDLSEPVIVSSGSLSAQESSLPSSVPNTYQLIGIRREHDSLRPKCIVIRRKLPRGDLPYGAEFRSDGIWSLGMDKSSHAEREKISKHLIETASPEGTNLSIHEERAKQYQERAMRYQEADGWMLVHRYRKSQYHDQDYDVSLYLIRHPSYHPKKDFNPIKFVKYAVGPNWSGSPYIIRDAHNGYELRLSAYGSFLCFADIYFTNGTSCRLERYVDFEMAEPPHIQEVVTN